MLLQDVRDYQILFLSLFLVLGIGTRDWTLRPDLLLVVLVTCLATQWIAMLIRANLQVLVSFLLRGRGGELTWDDAWGDSSRSLGDLPPKPPTEGRLRPPDPLQKGMLVQPKLVEPKLVELKLEIPANPGFRSALITGLGLCLLLRADQYGTMAIAAAVAILSKFVFQVRGKHFFNPANFGIITALILMPDAWVSPGQWGDEWWYALLFAGTGGMVVQRVGRWDTTVAFLGSYALLEAIRNVWLGWTWDVFGHRLMSGSLLLFALFMVTDPRSIPNARVGRLVWAGCIAGLTFVLRNQFFVATAVFWALFALAPLTVLLDWIWAAPRFSWFGRTPEFEGALVEQESAEIQEHYSQV